MPQSSYVQDRPLDCKLLAPSFARDNFRQWDLGVSVFAEQDNEVSAPTSGCDCAPSSPGEFPGQTELQEDVNI